MDVYSVCRVLFSVISFILWRKFLFLVFHYAYHIIDTLQNGMEELLEEILSHLLFTRVEHLVDEHNPLAIIALWVVDKIVWLFVSVVVYTVARIGLHVLENMRVNPLETIKESVVDPIKGFVLEKSRENENVFKRYVVAPIGDYAVKNIIKYVLSPIQKFVLSPIQNYVLPLIRKFVDPAPLVCMALLYAVEEYQLHRIGTPFAVTAPIQEYVQKYLLAAFAVPAPIQEYVQKYLLAAFAVPGPIQKYVLDVAARIQRYVLINPFAVLAPISVPSRIKIFARLLRGLFNLFVAVKIYSNLPIMFAKLAQIQRRLRIQHDIRKMKDFRYQFENLRNMTEVVRRLDVVAKANSEAIQPNARTWLTRVKQIIESSNLHGFEEVERLYSDRLERNFPRFD